jgi:hypothetical protein
VADGHEVPTTAKRFEGCAASVAKPPWCERGLLGDPLDALARDRTGAVWQYARRHELLSETLGPAGATAVGRRFQLAVAWLTTGTVLGALLPVLGVVVIAAFNAFYWLPIRGESPRRRPSRG